MLFTDASKYAWACVLTQEKIHQIEGKKVKILFPITYMSGLFRESQVNWACLTKEAYAIYMSINWAIEILPFHITFEYIKGIKNTLADTMSRLIDIEPPIQQDSEPEGYEFGYYTFDTLPAMEVSHVEMTKQTSNEKESNDTDSVVKLPLSEDMLSNL